MSLIVGLAIVSVGLRSGQVLAVQTASMRPLFAPGDTLWLQPKAHNFQVGQVVSYRSRLDPRQIVSHRIISCNVVNHELVTKGDNLPDPDPVIRDWYLLGRVEVIIPKGGYVLSWLFSWTGLVVAIYLPASVVLLFETKRLYASTKASRYYLWQQ